MWTNGLLEGGRALEASRSDDVVRCDDVLGDDGLRSMVKGQMQVLVFEIFVSCLRVCILRVVFA